MRSAAEEHPIILCQARHNIALLALSSATGILPRPDGGTCDCWAGQAELGTVHVVDLSTDIHLLGPSGAGAARRSRDHYAVRVSPRLPLIWVSRATSGDPGACSRCRLGVGKHGVSVRSGGSM